MSALALFLLQPVAASAPSPTTLPDIEITARVTAREVRIDQQGKAEIKLRAEPGVTPPVEVTRSAPRGQTSYRNLVLELEARAQLTDPLDRPLQQGTTDEADPR